MKKTTTIATTLLLTSSLFGDVVTVTPYMGGLSYDSSDTKTYKKSGVFYGAYANIGNLNYLAEAAYTKTEIKYKNPAYNKLNQDEFTLAYAYYWESITLRGGAHYINTNDPILGNGIVGFASIGGYTSSGYNRYNYGLEGYYSYYKDGRDEKNVKKSIGITQLTPYFSAYNVLSNHIGNLLSLKGNWQYTADYVKKSYASFEISDTLYYQKAFLTLKGYGGKMRTAVRQSGFVVVSTLDEVKSGYGASLGYYFTPVLTLTLDYELNNYREFGATQDGRYAVYNANLTMKF